MTKLNNSVPMMVEGHVSFLDREGMYPLSVIILTLSGKTACWVAHRIEEKFHPACCKVSSTAVGVKRRSRVLMGNTVMYFLYYYYVPGRWAANTT